MAIQPHKEQFISISGCPIPPNISHIPIARRANGEYPSSTTRIEMPDHGSADDAVAPYWTKALFLTATMLDRKRGALLAAKRARVFAQMITEHWDEHREMFAGISNLYAIIGLAYWARNLPENIGLPDTILAGASGTLRSCFENEAKATAALVAFTTERVTWSDPSITERLLREDVIRARAAANRARRKIG